MNSVTKDTPYILKVNKNVKIVRTDEIVDVEEECYLDNIIVTSWGHREFAACNNFEVWTRNGLQNFRKLVTPKTEKKLSNKNKT